VRVRKNRCPHVSVTLNRESECSDSSDVSPVAQVLVMQGVFVVLFVAANVVGASRCQRRIDEWATQNDFRLQSVERRWTYRGTPWGLWGTGRGTWLFRMTVVDAAGLTRSGWIRFRASLVGGTGKMEVRWPS
jgi:hypothetical protein